MKRRTIVLSLIMLVAGTMFANNPYRYALDLTQAKEDRLPVTLLTPKVSQDVIEFQMPKVVPGTYSISNFGRFVQDLEAFDAAGNKLEVAHGDDDPNRWKIKNATQLHKITYWVEDTWDTDQSGRIFEPGGTNIEAGVNFVINTFGFFGYLEGMKEIPFELEITKPEGFYGSTPLIAKSSDSQKDVFEVKDYNLLADSPMMYCVPDTAIKMVGGAEVLISVYSPNDRTHASAIMEAIAEILDAQRRYLGGTLPVEKYAFICYLTDGVGGSGGMGALEHSYSSLYYMPEVDDSRAGAMMKDVAAHEFFHIVTPLSVHSEEIHSFDFIDPKMSQHLWLYEGVTEYSAGHVQVYYDLMSRSEYLGVLEGKIGTAEYFIDDVPFTEISAGCLDEYKSQYGNVYQKGALIGMALDIQLRELSKGKMGLQDVMRRMEKKFGKDKPFKDGELFDQIASVSFPEIRSFFTKYVEGPNPLPYRELFEKVGIIYESDVDRQVLTMGRVQFGVNEETKRYMVTGTNRLNKFGKDMGYRDGDELVEFDGQKVDQANFEMVVGKFRKNHKVGDKIAAVVARPDGKGGYKMKKLKGKAASVRQKARHLLTMNTDASSQQQQLQDAWLGK